MTAGKKPQPTVAVTRLVFMIIGVLLTIGTPFALAMLQRQPQFRLPLVSLAGIEIASVVAGLVLLYLAFRETALPEAKN